MNKNIIKLFAILVMCFMIGAVLVACGADGAPGAAGANGAQGPQGEPGKDGEDAYVCENHVWNKDTIEISKHYYDAETGNVSTGSYLRVCDECGWAEVVKGEHDFEESTKEPTCTEAGGKFQTCKVCNYTTQDPADVVAALGHKVAVAFDKANIDTTVWTAQAKDANVCERDQDTVYKANCSVCGVEAFTETVAKLGHAPAAAFNKDAIADCWVADANDPAVCDCEEATVYRTNCVACDYEYVETVAAPGHDYQNYRPTINKSNSPSCVVNKTEVAPCVNCNTETNACGCKMDERVKEYAKGHTMGDWYFVDTPAAELGATGTARKVCTVCEAEGFVDFGANSEKFGNVETADLSAIAVNNADYTYTRTQASNCVNAEIGTFTHNKTGLEIAGVVVDEKGGHNIDGATPTVVTKPTFTAGGVVEVKCGVAGCGETLTYDLPALGSAYTKTTVADPDKFCEDIEADYAYTVSRNNDEVTGSFTVTIRASAQQTHVEIPAQNEWQYVESEDGKTISTVYWCENCEHWIVIDINPNPDYVGE